MPTSSTQLIHKPPYTCILDKGNPCAVCVELEAFDLAQSLATDAKLSASDAERRYILLRRLNKRHDPLYHYLPVEITSFIFELYFKGTGYAASIYCPNPQSPTTQRRPISSFRLTSVCSSWRSIGFSTPFLWSSISIYLTPKRTRTFDVKILEQWLLRAGALPLRIAIFFELGYYRHKNHGDKPIISMFEVIRSYAPQWEALNLTAPCRFSGRFLSCRKLDTPILKYLRLQGTEPQYSRENLYFKLKSPSLDTVLLANILVPTDSLDWTNVTRVHIKSIESDGFYWLLTHATKLEVAVFSDMFLYGGRQVYISTTPAIYPSSSSNGKVVPALRRFELQHRVTSGFPADLPDWFDPFNSFIIPSLKEFAYRFCPTWGGFDKTRFLANIARSQSTITHLTLDNIHPQYFEYEDLIEILTSLSDTLTHLRLHCNKDTPYAIGESVLLRICHSSISGLDIAGLGLEHQFESMSLTNSPLSAFNFLPHLEEFSCTNPLYSNDIYRLLVGILYPDQWKQISQMDVMIPGTNKVKGASRHSLTKIHTPQKPKIRRTRRPLHTLNIVLTTDDWTPRELMIVPFNMFSRLQKARVQLGVELSIVERYYTVECVSRESDVMLSSSRFYGLE